MTTKKRGGLNLREIQDVCFIGFGILLHIRSKNEGGDKDAINITGSGKRHIYRNSENRTERKFC